MGGNILFDLFKVEQNILKVLILFLQLLQKGINCVGSDTLIQFQHRFVAVSLNFPVFPDQVEEFIL